MKVLKKSVFFFLIILVIAQFFGPVKNEGDLTSIDAFLLETKPSENIKLILKESCYDCHSDVTRYPWYNKITPINYFLADHIKHGKKHFNVSKWEEYSIKRKEHKFEELIELVEEKVMPLNSYTWTHTKAKLTDNQIKEIIDWANLVRLKYGLEPKAE